VRKAVYMHRGLFRPELALGFAVIALVFFIGFVAVYAYQLGFLKSI
jgi:hypothetical protein